MFGERETLLLGEWGEGPLSHVMEIIPALPAGTLMTLREEQGYVPN